jgi:polysaccharide biosynthesis/export protein
MKQRLIILMACVFTFASCEPQRNLVYFSEGRTNPGVASSIPMEVKIQPDDVLRVSVNTLSPESNLLFNPTVNETGYKVDKSGNISLPVLGSIKVDGLTLEQAQSKISAEVQKYAKSPNVNVQFLNFKITVIGEVNRPNSFSITNDKVNLLEALGLAGDMTVYGKRENVLVIRQNGNERSMARVNMNNRDVINSPFFNLKQNDIVYVEPDRAKAASISANNKYIPIIIGAALSIASLFVRAYY